MGVFALSGVDRGECKRLRFIKQRAGHSAFLPCLTSSLFTITCSLPKIDGVKSEKRRVKK